MLFLAWLFRTASTNFAVACWRHHTYFSESGAILIVDLTMIIVLDKPDINARSITL